MQEMINSSITSPVSRILLRNQPSDSLGECFSYLIASLDALRSLTHTVLLLDELHQLLQDFIQNPADTNTGQEARSAGTGPFLLPGELSASPRGQQNTGTFRLAICSAHTRACMQTHSCTRVQ